MTCRKWLIFPDHEWGKWSKPFKAKWLLLQEGEMVSTQSMNCHKCGQIQTRRVR